MAFAGLLVCLLATASQASEAIEEPFLGVRRIQRVETSPRPLVINVLEIDLAVEGVRLQMTPRGPGSQPVFGGIPDETVIQTTRGYADAVGAQAAINGSFFAAVHSHEGKLWTNNLGLTASNGDAYSPWESPFTANFDDALNVTQDNQAAIVRMPNSIPTGFETDPPVTLYNTVTGSHRLLSGGVNVAPSPTGSDGLTLVHPRTAVGVTGDQKLLMMTVDGRQPGYSEGVNLVELANLLADYGAVDAINLDGGGSTTMGINYYDDQASLGSPFPTRLANSPSGSERSVGTNLALFAEPNPAFPPPQQAPTPPDSTQVFDSFENGAGRFNASFTASPYTYGVATSSQRAVVRNESHFAEASQRLVVRSSDPPTPGLRLVHLSGGGVSGNNIPVEPIGQLGFYLKVHPTGVQTGDLTTSLLIDDGGSLERGAPIDVIADGAWHLYEWRLDDASYWDSFDGGNGQLDHANITLHGLYFEAESNLDFTVFVDMVAHNPQGSLAPPPLIGDFDGNQVVDLADYQLWRQSFGEAVAPGTTADGDGDGVVNAADFTLWRDHFDGDPTAARVAGVPAPASGHLAALVALLTAAVGASRRDGGIFRIPALQRSRKHPLAMLIQ